MVHFIHNGNGMLILSVYIPSGSIYETTGMRGISHLLEHLLFKNTESYSGNELLKLFTQLGGYYNASTDKDETIFYIKTMAENYQLATDIIHDIVIKPLFNSKDITIERKVVLEESARLQDSLDDIIYDESTTTLLPSSNIYSTSVIGLKSHLKNMRVSDIKRYYRDRFKNMIVLVNCDTSYLGDAKAYIKKKFRDSQRLPDEPQLYSLSQQFHSVVKVVDANINQYNTVLLFPTYKFSDIKANIILQFLQFCLTDAGLYSLLVYEVREKRGLVYSIKFTNERHRYLGLTRIVFGTSNKDTVNIVRVILDLLRNLAKNGLRTDVLLYFKKSCVNFYRFKFANEEYRTSWHGHNIFYGCKLTEEKMIDMMNSITNDDIRTIATEVFGSKFKGVYTMGRYNDTVGEIKQAIQALL
jgi:predicted Zn-dependent peptidase